MKNLPASGDVQKALSDHYAVMLCDAAGRRDTAAVRELLNSNTDPNHSDESGRLPLLTAVHAGSLEAVGELLDVRADANLQERGGGIPLQICAWKGNRELTKALLAASAKVNAADGRGWTPLCTAAHRGHTAVVQLLLERSADACRASALGGRAEPLTPLQAIKASTASAEVKSKVAALLREAEKNSRPPGCAALGRLVSSWCCSCAAKEQGRRLRKSGSL